MALETAWLSQQPAPQTLWRARAPSESYTALMKDIGAPIEPFVAGVLSTMLDKCSDKVRDIIHNHLCAVAASISFETVSGILLLQLFGLQTFWPACCVLVPSLPVQLWVELPCSYPPE